MKQARNKNKDSKTTHPSLSQSIRWWLKNFVGGSGGSCFTRVFSFGIGRDREFSSNIIRWTSSSWRRNEERRSYSEKWRCMISSSEDLLLLLMMMMLWEKGREACKCEWSLSYREYWHGWWVENLRAGRVAFGLDWVINKDNNNTPLLKFQFGDFFFIFFFCGRQLQLNIQGVKSPPTNIFSFFFVIWSNLYMIVICCYFLKNFLFKNILK